MRAQDRLARAFGIGPLDRCATVLAMLTPKDGERASYWLQLVISMTIATFGLVLGSTAVVIGAMLISPLMGPLVGLGMGLAVGSTLLVLRSLARTALSLAVVIGGAALITVLLPFHEMTGEISSRVSPTALDLLVAISCAVAATYAVTRPASETAATAAGTAIGIALVPPLCVVGYGFGTRSIHVAAGASLLFTANLCGILLFTGMGFFTLGYGQVDIGELERDELEKPGAGMARRAARTLKGLFASKYGPVSRVAMPVALLLAVYLPLHRALAEVSWQVRTRSEVERALHSLSGPSVESSVHIQQHQVDVRLVMVGSEEAAQRLRTSLVERIAAVAGVRPTVDVIAVPDADSLQRIQAELDQARPHVVPQAPGSDLRRVRRDLDDALAKVWPVDTAGPLIGWRLVADPGAPLTVVVVHAGPGLGASAESLLSKDLSERFGAPLVLRDVALPLDAATAAVDAGADWLPSAFARVGLLDQAQTAFACVTLPTDTKGRVPRDARVIADIVQASPEFRGARVTMEPGALWAIRLSLAPCESRSESDGGPGGAVRDAESLESSSSASPR